MMPGRTCLELRALPGQSAQVLVALRNTFKRLLRVVVFDDVVLDPTFVGLCEDALPVDDAAANFGQIDGVAEVLRAAGRHFGFCLEIFHVHEREASGILVEILQWIGACGGDPAKIHFHLYEIVIA